MNMFKAFGKGAKAVGKGVARGLGFGGQKKSADSVPGMEELMPVYDEMGESPEFQALEDAGLASDGDGDEMVEDPEFAASTAPDDGAIAAALAELFPEAGPDANMQVGEGWNMPSAGLAQTGARRDTTKSLKGNGMPRRPQQSNFPGASIVLQERPITLGMGDVLSSSIARNGLPTGVLDGSKPAGMLNRAMIRGDVSSGLPTTPTNESWRSYGAGGEGGPNYSPGEMDSAAKGAMQGAAQFLLPSVLSQAGGLVEKLFGKGGAKDALKAASKNNPKGLSSQTSPSSTGPYLQPGGGPNTQYAKELYPGGGAAPMGTYPVGLGGRPMPGAPGVAGPMERLPAGVSDADTFSRWNSVTKMFDKYGANRRPIPGAPGASGPMEKLPPGFREIVRPTSGERYIRTP